MIFTKTANLIAAYGEALRNNTITDEQLQYLMKKGIFKAYFMYGYYIPDSVSNNNHTELDAMENFVAVMGAELDDDTLHTLVTRMFNLIPAIHLPGTFKNAHLATTFLAYELSRIPDKAKSIYQSENFQTAFKNVNIESQMNTLLEPVTRYFIRNRHSVTGSSSSSSLSSQLAPLIQEIEAWKAMRIKEGDLLEQDNQDRQYFTLWSRVFTGMSEKVKIAAADKMLDHLRGNITCDFTVKDVEALNDGRLGEIIEKLEQAKLLPEAFIDKESAIAISNSRMARWGTIRR